MAIRNLTIPVLALAALTATQAGAAPKVIELSPISPWHVEWNKDACTVRSLYGAKEKPVFLQLERFAPNDGFAVVVSGKVFAGYAPGNVNIVYGPGGVVDEQKNILPGNNGAGVPALFFDATTILGQRDPATAVPITPEQEKATTSIAFSKRGRSTIVLKTGRLDKVFAEIRRCTDDLLRYWKLDPQQQIHRTRPPVATSDPGRWLRSSDYPGNVLRAGKQSQLNVVMLVDETGKSTDCRIQRSYGDEAFTRRTCEALTKRATFEPALDSQGKPLASYYVTKVSWLIE